MNKTVIIAVVLIIVAGVGGFFGGMYYQKSQTVSHFAQSGGGAGGAGGYARRFGQGGTAGANGMNVVRGQVVNTDSNSITIKLPDGSSKIIVVGSSTSFMKSATGTLSDLKTGDSVMAFGTTNSDGSVTAQSVQINPPGRGPMPSSAPTQ